MITAPKRILIYRLGSLGDTVIALPVFNKIREQYPDADITLLTNKPIVDKAAPLQAVLGDGYFYNRILTYPIGTRNPVALFKLLQQIRALKIDAVMYLAGVRVHRTLLKTKLTSYRDYLFFKAAGAKNNIGFPLIKEDYELCIDPATGIYEWEAKRLARRFKSLGDIPLDDGQYWNLHLTAEEEQQAEKVLAGIISNGPIFAISSGTKNQANDWEEKNWLAVIAQLKAVMPNWQLLIVGAADEAERAEKYLAIWQGEGVNLCGKTSPRISGAVLRRARMFIGHDSGPMHLAAGVGVPCVAIFPAKNMRGQWFPRGSNNKIIYHQTDCAGCGLDTCIVQQKKCILSITVHEVYNAVLEQLTLLEKVKL